MLRTASSGQSIQVYSMEQEAMLQPDQHPHQGRVAHKKPRTDGSAMTTAQTLPIAMSKGSRKFHAVIPVQMHAESGTFMSLRVKGIVPGLPYMFAFPTIINTEDHRHTAAGFGFQGYLEVWNGAEIGAFGHLHSPSPAIKMVGKGAYFQRDAQSLDKLAPSTTPLVSI